MSLIKLFPELSENLVLSDLRTTMKFIIIIKNMGNFFTNSVRYTIEADFVREYSKATNTHVKLRLFPRSEFLLNSTDSTQLKEIKIF